MAAVVGRLYKVNELVQVESVDAGFEGAHFEAVVQKMLSVAPPAAAAAGADSEGAAAAAAAASEPRIMYDVKYTRFVSAAGTPIVEAVCEARIRPVPPELTGYAPSLGDFVDAFWREGWWVGTIVKLVSTHAILQLLLVSRTAVTDCLWLQESEGDDGEDKCLVRFPEHSAQEIWLTADDLRPLLQLREAAGPWYRKIQKAADADGAAAAAGTGSEWIALDPMAVSSQQSVFACDVEILF